jgi:hypothetical protein
MHCDYKIGSSSHEYILEYECMTILSISKHWFNNPWVVGYTWLPHKCLSWVHKYNTSMLYGNAISAIVELTRPIGYWNHVGMYGFNLSAEFGNHALVMWGRE